MPVYKSLGDSLLSSLEKRLNLAISEKNIAEAALVRKEISNVFAALGNSSPELSEKYRHLADSQDKI